MGMSGEFRVGVLGFDVGWMDESICNFLITSLAQDIWLGYSLYLNAQCLSIDNHIGK